MKNRDAFRQEETETTAGIPLGVQSLSFLCGLGVAYLGFKSVYQDYESIRKLTHLERFIETPGKFLQVKIRKDSTGSDDELYPDILYEYFVEGKSIWGWQLSYEEKPRSRAYWEERLKAYQLGAPVPVYYNPELPKDAILEKKHDGLYRSWMKMLLGAGFMVAGLTLAILPAVTWMRKLGSLFKAR